MITLLAALSLSGLLNVLLYLIIVALIFWLVWWLLGYIGLPEPFNKVVRIILAVIAVIIVANILLGLTGNAFIDL